MPFTRMTVLILMLCVYFSSSCKSTSSTYYKYGDVTVTRVDFDGATNFYYGERISVPDAEVPCLSVEYYGRNNCMDVYLIFNHDGSVEVIPYGCGYLQKKGDCKIKIGDYRNDKIKEVLDKYTNLGYGMIRLSNSVEVEKSFFENRDSKVVVKSD